MAQYSIIRPNHKQEYAYFIPLAGKDWRIELGGNDYTFAEDGKTVLTATPFTVRISSEVDSVATLQAYLEKHAALTVTSSQPTLIADGVDSVLWTLQSGASASYTIMRYNIAIASGNTNDGSVEFATTEAGEYMIEFQNAQGQTGYSEVAAHAS